MSSTWHNRITRYSSETPDQLLANPYNHKVHTTLQQDALSEVLNTIGIVQNVIVNEITGHVVDGHARILLALRENQDTLPVTWIAVSEQEEIQLILFFDEIASYAGKDRSLLRTALDMLDGLSFDRPGMKQMFDDLDKTAKKLLPLPPTDDLYSPASPLFPITGVTVYAGEDDEDLPYAQPESVAPTVSGRGNVIQQSAPRTQERFALSIVLTREEYNQWLDVKDRLGEKLDTPAFLKVLEKGNLI